MNNRIEFWSRVEKFLDRHIGTRYFACPLTRRSPAVRRLPCGRAHC
ncbi:MAG: hypothetical protein ABWY27_08310 [Telluria sp.]